MARKMPSSPPCDVLSFAKRMRPSLRRRDGSGAFLISAVALLSAGGGHISIQVQRCGVVMLLHKWSLLVQAPRGTSERLKHLWCLVTVRSLVVWHEANNELAACKALARNRIPSRAREE